MILRDEIKKLFKEYGFIARDEIMRVDNGLRIDFSKKNVDYYFILNTDAIFYEGNFVVDASDSCTYEATQDILEALENSVIKRS